MKRPILRKKENQAIILAGIVLICYITSLLVANYLAQVKIQKSVFEQLRQDTEKRAAAVSYFLSERINDLQGIAKGRELGAFFVNKALGMSMKYGLSANLEDIEKSFDNLLIEKKLGDDHIYTRIDFVTKDGKLLATRSTEKGLSISSEALKETLTPDNQAVGTAIHSNGQDLYVILSLPFRYKEKYVGQIITWVELSTIYKHLLQIAEGESRRVLHVGFAGRYLALPTGVRALVDTAKLPADTVIPYGLKHRFTAEVHDVGRMEIFALRVPVRDTDFCLLTLVPYGEFFGQTTPWRLFLVLGSLAVAVLASLGFLLRINHQNLILNVRLEESGKREEAEALKNRQLVKEIRDREEMEKALRISEKKYRELYESMRDGLVLSDMQGNIVGSNQAFREMLGYTEEEIIGLSYEKTIPPKWHDHESQILHNQILIRGYSEIYEKEYICKDQRTVSVELRTYLFCDEKGKATGTWAIVRDISDRKQTEAELKRAKDAAEAASRAKSEFLASMSHELRTPLNHIMGFTELVLRKNFGDLNEIQTEYLNDSLQSSRHLLSLINDILDISKVEAGKLELKLSSFDLKALLEKSLNMIREKAIRHGIRLSTNIRGLPDEIEADERKIKQIVYNLLSNAAKFTPDGGSIRLDAERLSRLNGNWVTTDHKPVVIPARDGACFNTAVPCELVMISVEDTGIGIQRKELDRIFEPFEQSENSKRHKYQGTGLGLSLTKNFVELHKGCIWAESEGIDKGSCFHFAVPLKGA